ncbi:MAG: hypothetical protein HY046_06860, partial [Acidobacteria bacterium]|nr:hypothetical protein [Acidobacteriota bacterium]
GQRFCLAKGETICAECCGTEREVTIDCPADCRHLVSARKWEHEHRKPLPPEDFPFPEVRVSPAIIRERGAVVPGLGLTILRMRDETASLTDADALEALSALAEAYRTLGSGIIYEKPPAGPVASALYARLVEFLEQYKKETAEHSSSPPLRETEIFHLLIFLLRMGKSETNGRRKSRAFLDFLRTAIPPEVGAAKKEESRIIMP